ncbi:MAG: hypothetical protein RR547_12850, partial [Raoultibacter sp.]
MSTLVESLVIVACAGILFAASCTFVLRWTFSQNSRRTDGRLAVFSVGSFACCLMGCLIVSDFLGNAAAAVYAGSVLVLVAVVGMVLLRNWRQAEAHEAAETVRLRELLAEHQATCPSLA